MWKNKFKFILNKNSRTVSFNRLTDIHKERTKIIRILKKDSTPLFLSDGHILAGRISELERSCRNNWANFQLAYSFKTNYEIAKSKIVKSSHLWAEVVSGYEYQMAKKLGYEGTEIIFNGPFKTDSDIKTALNGGSLIFVDNLDELERIRKIASLSKKKFEIGIRLRTKIPRIEESRFGFSLDNGEAIMACSLIDKDPLLNLVGFHMHLGSDIGNPKVYRFAASAASHFIEKNINNFENEIKFLDFGGGYPSRGLAPFGSLRWNLEPIENYIQAITLPLSKIFKKTKPVLILEPGRYLADDSVFFITKVIGCKNKSRVQILTTDSSVTMLPLVQYRPQVVKLYDKNMNERKSQALRTTVYGASCRENDILYNDFLPKARVGDLLIFFITGAYNQNMASEFIFRKPKCISL